MRKSKALVLKGLNYILLFYHNSATTLMERERRRNGSSRGGRASARSLTTWRPTTSSGNATTLEILLVKRHRATDPVFIKGYFSYLSILNLKKIKRNFIKKYNLPIPRPP